MGKYGWDSKIGDLLADERCVAVFKESCPRRWRARCSSW